MSRKSLIICLSALALMIAGVGIAVVFLYSGDGERSAVEAEVDFDNPALDAVPSDAAAVFCFSDCRDADYPFLNDSLFNAAGSLGAVVSLHYSAELVPLYIFDVGRVSEEPSDKASRLLSTAARQGMTSRYVNASRAFVLASRLENIVNSSVRHMEQEISVLDAPGFAEAAMSVGTKDAFFLSNDHARRLVSAVLTKRHAGLHSFISRFSDWMGFRADDWSFEGRAVYKDDQTDFMSVLESLKPAESSVAAVLPSHTLSFFSLQLKVQQDYITAYEAFVDSKQGLPKYIQRQRELLASAGMEPADLLASMQPEEMVKASFKLKGRLEEVNAAHVGKAFARNCAEGVQPYPYAGFFASVLGDFFLLDDETYSLCADGWLFTGSKAAMEELSSAQKYSLAEKLDDASASDALSYSDAVAVGYFSLTEDRDELRNILSNRMLQAVSSLTDGFDMSSVVFAVRRNKNGMCLSSELLRENMQRTKAPVVERDTTVIVPEGPFQVKNSGSGKMNSFYQNSHLSLCLSEEGKDLWGVPFKEKICGIAQTVDYYANGKLQILFGAGSRIYLIDRLGRFVKGFPVDLGKEILLGPQAYDFSGARRYNIMVLHKDNSVEMYNLKGAKPESWKGIRTQETIKALPELLSVGGNSFWLLRTSIQTLIYPFYGGEPLSVFEGDKKIRPDSKVTVKDETSVEVECYDGHRRTVKLK